MIRDKFVDLYGSDNFRALVENAGLHNNADRVPDDPDELVCFTLCDILARLCLDKDSDHHDLYPANFPSMDTIEAFLIQNITELVMIGETPADDGTNTMVILGVIDRPHYRNVITAISAEFLRISSEGLLDDLEKQYGNRSAKLKGDMR